MKRNKDIKTLWCNPEPKMYTEIFEFNGRIFSFHFEHTNGAPCGFNYKCCADIMLPDGTFKHIIDNHIVGCSWKNYYLFKDSQAAAENEKAMSAFINYIVSVYGEKKGEQ